LRAGATATPAALKAFCIERGPLYSHPRHIVVAPTLPQNGAGKIDRAVVRRELQAHAAEVAEAG
jgi:long-chain acyl-CoA synthetase